jgi:hypothetical protein
VVTIKIDVSQVPEQKRADFRFLFLLADIQRRCADPQVVKAICAHEAGHVFYLGRAGRQNPSACGPKITYDPIKDKFDDTGSSVDFDGWDQQLIASLTVGEWLSRLAKGYVAGGVAARILANSTERGDAGDRELFDGFFEELRVKHPDITETSDSLWIKAQNAVANDLQNDEIKKIVLKCAEILKPDLFCAVSSESRFADVE